MGNSINKNKNENKSNDNSNQNSKQYKNKNSLNFILKSNLVKDSYANRHFTNTFTIFKSINNFLFLIYSSKNKSIICYDLENEKQIAEIKNAHTEYCFNIRYYLDIINKRDLIISIFDQNSLKIWNIKNFECILSLSNINKKGFISLACILKENNINYLITSNYVSSGKIAEPIKIFDLDGKFIKEIENSSESTLILDNYFDENLSKNYIISGNINHVKSYDYTSNTIYHKYFDIDNSTYHSDVVIKSDKNIINLIESCDDGYIRIWNFHSGILLNKIYSGLNESQYCLCLWDNQYLILGCISKFLLIDYQNNKIVDTFNYNPLTMKKVNLSKYGKCLICQGAGRNEIAIWLSKN